MPQCVDCGRAVKWRTTGPDDDALVLCAVHYNARVFAREPITGAPSNTTAAALDEYAVNPAAPEPTIHWRPREWVATACGLNVGQRRHIVTAPVVHQANCGSCLRANIAKVVRLH